MTTDEAINHYGGIYKLSAALDLHPNAIRMWGGRPPMGRQYEMQVKTNGVLMADGVGGTADEGGANAAG